MIHVDDPMTFNEQFKDWCHLWSADMDLDELNAFAKRLGLKQSWLQHSQGRCGDFWHYDISPAKRTQALQMGATYKRLIDWINETVFKRQIVSAYKSAGTKAK